VQCFCDTLCQLHSAKDLTTFTCFYVFGIPQIFKTAPEFADVTNTRVLNSSRTVTQNPLPLSSSQTNSSGLPSSAGPVRQSTFAQSYLAAAGASQSNNKPVMRSGVSRSVAGPSVYANVPVSAEPMGTTSGRGRSQPSGMQLLLIHF